jgi:hypothetical protein
MLCEYNSVITEGLSKITAQEITLADIIFSLRSCEYNLISLTWFPILYHVSIMTVRRNQIQTHVIILCEVQLTIMVRELAITEHYFSCFSCWDGCFKIANIIIRTSKLRSFDFLRSLDLSMYGTCINLYHRHITMFNFIYKLITSIK